MIGIEEKQMIIDLFPFLSDTPVILDIGSNKGDFTKIFLDEYKENCEIHLFEPVEILLNYTKIRFEYEKNIHYNGLAAYKESGKTVSFYYFENFNNELSSIYRDVKDWEGLPMKEKKVHAITIDQYCENLKINEVDYLKIDVEGADVDVLEGCRKLLSDSKVRILQIEFSKHYERAGKSFSDILAIAKATGYTVYNYKIDNFWEVKEVTDPMPENNYILTKYQIHNFSINGWNNEFIINTMELPKVHLAIELGAMEGCTTKYICQHLLDDSGEGRVIVIDPLNDYYVTDDPRYHPEFKHQYQRFKRNTRGLPVDLKRGESKDELPKLHAIRADLIFVDGNHYAPWPYHDLCWAFAITKVGGVIIADDYNLWAQETKDSIDKFLKEFVNSYELIHSGYQVVIKKKQDQYNELTFDYYK